MNRLISFIALSLLAISCTQNIIIEDFENGTGFWTIEGDAFTSTTQNSDGNWILKSSEDDNTLGSSTSGTFVISGDYINLLIGGSVHSGWGSPSNTVQLFVDDVPVCTVFSISENPDTLEWLSMDVKSYKGQSAYLKINVSPAMTFGNRTLPRGYISVDRIEQSNKRLSHYYPEFTTSMKADKRYILIPATLKGSSSKLSVFVDDVNILGIEQNCTPARDTVDYYIPIDVSQFAGKNVTVKLTGIKDSYTVYTGIRTSDSSCNEYNEKYRPRVHFSPEFGWTNDPNGMVYADGKWHLSLQYNPYATSHGNMHWGLSVSEDLIHWKDYPAVIAPDSLGAIFSGSAVVDHNNTAGFGKDAVVAIYTNSGSGQVQSIAYSLDNGFTFTKYDGNPVLSDSSQRNFRDPKVSWVEDKWVMALAVGQVIRFYGSPDLKDWTLLSEFGEGIGSHDGVWECPDLMKLNYQGEDKWVLFVSINPGGPNGGSITQYFIGNFDGKNFKADKLPYPLWVDEGVDNYAGVTYSNAPDGRTVFQGWMSNWVYTGTTPTIAFRNSMTLPRDLSLKSNGNHLILSSVPSAEVYAARGGMNSFDGGQSVDSYTIPSICDNNPGSYELDFTVRPDSKGTFSFSLSNDLKEETVFMFDLKDNKLTLDRSRSGIVDFHQSFSNPVIVNLNPRGEYKFQLFVDKLSTELFINDGDMVFTNCVFPTEDYNIFNIKSESCKMDIYDVVSYKLN